jgi:16S rRNA (cytosine1402-N4)-methyltransferase
LAGLLRAYADERFAGRIARAIVQRRQISPITRTADLAELVRDAIPAAGRRTGGHPAKRTFQALRIEVNAEWDSLERALPAAVERLAVGGRIAVLSYHSGEDRMVKYLLGQATQSSAPPGLPVEPEATKPQLRWLTRGGEKPCAQEVAGNRRAASARLRVAEKIRRPA